MNNAAESKQGHLHSNEENSVGQKKSQRRRAQGEVRFSHKNKVLATHRGQTGSNENHERKLRLFFRVGESLRPWMGRRVAQEQDFAFQRHFLRQSRALAAQSPFLEQTTIPLASPPKAAPPREQAPAPRELGNDELEPRAGLASRSAPTTRPPCPEPRPAKRFRMHRGQSP